MTTKGNTPRPFPTRQIKTTQSTKTTEDNKRKKTRKKAEQDFDKNFIFDGRTHFNELDQSTPLSDNYKNSEICKH